MANHITVKKSSGETQEFSEEKLIQSLRNSGASEEIIRSILPEIRKSLYEGISTRVIYRKAFAMLRRRVNALAARYSLKNAIMELGPTGYPFEKFVGELMKKMGYEVLTGQILPGKCVNHEVDVVAWKDNHKILIECKYHNTAGKVSSVQVPLYIQSRFLDVKSVWESQQENAGKTYQGWVVTNTRFSDDAEAYGKCAGLHLIGWNYPRRGSLKELVQQTGNFPITVITGLNKKQKQQLIDKGVVLCSGLCEKPELLNSLSLTAKARNKIIHEVRTLCSLAITTILPD
ncbi:MULTISPECIES: restriction endonuclease [Lentimicrobium]|mgnify:FL=1|uniref:Restriction endonuclease n=1 Tax=Lentimicrobium saccharophilum TaxID=1678841 RepID=A0A0S7C621_9BACT|nr:MULTISPECIES: restriction endonuclease [Lentimicrobium]MCO5256619.1 restriction endonuclease [Lentimicrobium sp.]MCO5264036.1 restriction endonuclease [Lentimicrobium sp.]GAP44617.1 restriction endonuclease [Lentimicrobium saccharophilum]HOP14204.1 restriction endonuclease [Lentimicrobium sp.]HPF64534.1 restriction endonuclease [Lentimicrobium sp.]